MWNKTLEWRGLEGSCPLSLNSCDPTSLSGACSGAGGIPAGSLSVWFQDLRTLIYISADKSRLTFESRFSPPPSGGVGLCLKQKLLDLNLDQSSQCMWAKWLIWSFFFIHKTAVLPMPQEWKECKHRWRKTATTARGKKKEEKKIPPSCCSRLRLRLSMERRENTKDLWKQHVTETTTPWTHSRRDTVYNSTLTRSESSIIHRWGRPPPWAVVLRTYWMEGG